MDPALAADGALAVGGAEVVVEALVGGEEAGVDLFGILVGCAGFPGVGVAIGGGAVDGVEGVAPFGGVGAVAGD